MSSKKNPRKKPLTNQLRLIAGVWRGSKLNFADGDGLRPTSERVRETLFNWLAPHIKGAHCLDLFAGSGALAFEALSRGAATAYAIDTNRQAVAIMQSEARRLGAHQLSVCSADALRWLASQPLAHGESRFNIVFLDPPFASDFLPEVVVTLEQSGLLAVDARIYIELPGEADLPAMPAHWQLLKQRRAGNVQYLLFVVEQSGSQAVGSLEA